MEKWDLLDENRQPLNITMDRKDYPQIKPGLFHAVIDVFTVNAKGEILVTFRATDKEEYPNKWECTSGSVLAGETSRQAAVRELAEETGIIVEQQQLDYLGTYKGRSAFFDIYRLSKEVTIEQLTLQAGETVAAKFVSLDQLRQMIADESFVKSTGHRLLQVLPDLKRLILPKDENE